MFVAGMFNEVDEVNIIFPVPGEAEVEVHVSIVKARPEFVEGMRAERWKMLQDTGYVLREYLFPCVRVSFSLVQWAH